MVRVAATSVALVAALVLCVVPRMTHLDTENCLAVHRGWVILAQSSLSSPDEIVRLKRAVERVLRARTGLCVAPTGNATSIIVSTTLSSMLHGSADFARRRISINASDVRLWSDEWLVATIKHELAHIALNDDVLQEALPNWYAEGFANQVGGTVTCEDTAAAVVQLRLQPVTRDPAARGHLVRRIRTELVEEQRFITSSAVRMLVDSIGTDNLRRFHDLVARRGFDIAVQATTGKALPDLLIAWYLNLGGLTSRSDSLLSCH